jgi:hypothetical protein
MNPASLFMHQYFAAAGVGVVVDLLPDPAQPAAAAYPLTLPSAAALFHSMETVRYRCACVRAGGVEGLGRCAV